MPAPGNDDVPKIELLRELGFGGDVSAYEESLERSGLSRPDKKRIRRDKRERVRDVLEREFFRCCSRGDCKAGARASADGRRVVPAASQDWCEVCGGSSNALAVRRMIEAMAGAGASRLCVVGGSPGTRAELAGLAADAIELRAVDGNTAIRAGDGAALVKWADVVVIWAATELDHKVSTQFRGPNVVTAPGRGIAQVARTVVRFFAG